MVNSADRKTAEQADRKAQEKARRRAEQAAIVTALQQILEGDENLLGFARGRIAGGWRGKLNVGPEAFLAPFINIGLTDRRILLQHIHPESGKPSEILPHSFLLTDILDLSFSDIETFGAEKACRLVLRLNSEQNFRIRLVGNSNVESAEAMTEVFRSLTDARRKTAPSPTRSACPNCHNVLDQPSKFCPYCGHKLGASAPASAEPPTPAEPEAEPEIFASTAEPIVELEILSPPVESIVEPEIFDSTAEPIAEPEIFSTADAIAEPEIFSTADAIAEPEIFSTADATVEPEIFSTAEPSLVAEQIETEEGTRLNEEAPPVAQMQEDEPTSVPTAVAQSELQEAEVVETHFADEELSTDRYEEPTSEPLSDSIEAQNHDASPIAVVHQPDPEDVADTPPAHEGEL